MIFLTILVFIWLAYTFLLTNFYRSWKISLKPQISHKDKNSVSFEGISLIIAARNESENIDRLFESISNQLLNNELYEVILIDDSSEDDTLKVAEKAKEKYSLVNLRIMPLPPLSGKGKKAALNFAITQAKFPLIAVTDADCYLPSPWLTKLRDNIFYNNVRAVCGPVLIQKPVNNIGALQEIDFATTSLINAGAAAGKFFFLGNSANFAFYKDFFFEAGGYSSDKNASGDDVLLLQKMASLNPDAIYYTPERDSIVYTRQEMTISSFYNQRLRWASKNNTYKNFTLNITQITVYFANLNQLLLTIWLLLFPFISVPLAVVSLVLVKISMDYFIAENALRFYHRKSKNIFEFIQLNYMYAFYISLVATKSIFVKKYVWKSRKVS